MNTYSKIQWNEEAEKGLSRALPAQWVRDCIAAQVRAGTATLWKCESERDLAFCVTRIDRDPTELCIVAFEGTGAKEFGPFFFKRAHAAGIAVRVHIVKRSLWRLYRRLGLGLVESEMILRSYPNEQRRQGQSENEHEHAIVYDQHTANGQ